MADEDHTPPEAKDYYSKSLWWSETAQPLGDLKRSDRNGVNGIYFDAGRDYYGNNSLEIATPEISESFEAIKGLSRTRISERTEENKGVTSTGNGVDEITEAGDEENGDYDHYSIQELSTEIVEIVEDGKSITSDRDRRADDLYVAVDKDDLDVVQWALDHAVSPGSRIFLIHVSPPITMIPTPGNKKKLRTLWFVFSIFCFDFLFSILITKVLIYFLFSGF